MRARAFIAGLTLLAFAVGAALGLLIASLIARRLARIARAAKAIGEGDFGVCEQGCDARRS